MKTSIALAFILAVIVVACDKGRFQTKPQLKLKSQSPEIVPKTTGSALTLNIEYTDKEGDVTDSIIIVRQRLNKARPVRTPPAHYTIPDFPKMDRGEFEITLAYQLQLITGITPISTGPTQFEIDTLLLKIVAMDKAGNKSDTLVVDKVYVIR